MDEQATMHIGEDRRAHRAVLRSLRHWEEVGLLRPSGRTDGGFRLYTEDDVAKVLVIRRMKPLGFSIEEMKARWPTSSCWRALRPRRRPRSARRERLGAVAEDARERRERLVRQLAMADEFIGLLEGRRADSRVVRRAVEGSELPS